MVAAAIELAAARIKLLPPLAMLAAWKIVWISDRGARDLPARQQTLRQRHSWSYDLLDEDEQNVPAPVVFVGGFPAEAIEAVRWTLRLTSPVDQLGCCWTRVAATS